MGAVLEVWLLYLVLSNASVQFLSYFTLFEKDMKVKPT